MRILLVEDEKRLSGSLRQGLIEAGFAVDQAFNGTDGLFLAQEESYDCLILDIMLPEVSGLEICRKLRELEIATPILMLTAKNTAEDISSGLDTGADDYLVKPFAFIELKSRIQALIRRASKKISPILTVSDLILNPRQHSVSRGAKLIQLTPKEFSILEYLMIHSPDVVTRTMITEHVWDYNFDSMSNVVDVFIASLRKKIDTGYSKKLIHTVHGVGFMVGAEKT